MPQGDKSVYTDNKSTEPSIVEVYEDRGVSEKKPSVLPGPPPTKESGGGNKSGPGHCGLGACLS